MSSSFGNLFRLTSFGESHGPAVGVVVDGCPPRLPLDAEEIQRDLDRRRPGQSRLVTQRQEADRAEILSGLYEGRTTGTPLAIVVANADQQPGAYDHLRDVYRPSHADFAYDAKYGFRDHRGGGRSSARETVARVAAGAVARKLLSVGAGVEVVGWVAQVHDLEATVDPARVSRDEVECGPTRCPDVETAAAMEAAIEAARRDGDSLGGIVACVARGVPAGLGEPVFDKLDAALAGALMSLPAAKGVEIGSGFAGVRLTGRQHNDAFVGDGVGEGAGDDDGDSTERDARCGAPARPRTATNHSGGVQGGISNGADILVRVAFKPTATIASPQATVDRQGRSTTLAAKGRHDPCVLPRAVPLVEAMICLVLADHWLLQRAVDVLPRTARDRDWR